MEKLRIMLAEDHLTVREGIKLLINSQPDMQVIGEVGDGSEAVKEAQKLLPDIVVMDVSMPKLNGLKATMRLKTASPDIKILTLTRHTNDAYLQQLIESGESGYILKQSAPTELIRAVRTVADGKSFLDQALTAKMFSVFSSRFKSLRGEFKTPLTERESEVLRYIALGYSNKEIAELMQVSVKTIEAHKANAMRKLGMQSRIDIVRYAILQGWMEEN